MSTKERILDAAERLFAHHGVEATSLRAITTEAGVNLAAVNYHFQSKDALVQAVISRRMDPITERRLAMLDACEAAAGNRPAPLEKILEAFLLPVVEAGATHASGFAPMLGRIYTEPKEFVEKVFKNHLATVAERFRTAFGRALPHLSEEELHWRVHWVVGAMAHTVGARHMLEITSHGKCDLSDVQATVMRMESFLMAGLQAPVPEVVKC